MRQAPKALRRLPALVGQWLCAIAARIPLFGRLGEVPREAQKQAFFETLTTTLFATAPFSVLPLFGYFLLRPRPELGDALRRGEGLIYASVLLGPLVYVITKRYGKFSLRLNTQGASLTPLSISFPYGGAFLTITAFTCAIAGIAFAVMQRSGPDDSGVDQSGVRLLSWILMVIATVVFFLVTAYRNMLDDIEKNKAEMVVEAQPNQEKAFLNSWLGAKI